MHLPISSSEMVSTTCARPDQQDYQWAGVNVQVAHQLGVLDVMIVVNKLPHAFKPEDVKLQVEQTYHCPVGVVLPHPDEIMTLASSGIFALRYPDDRVSKLLKDLVEKVACLKV